MTGRRLVAAVCAAALSAVAATAWAQATPLGQWKSIDDKTGEAKAQMRITEQPDGTLSGRIEKLLRPPSVPNPVCRDCSDDRKDQPIVGLEIIRGVKKAPDKDGVWDGGRILDPENGTSYALRLTPIDGGQKLQVRGSFGPFSRTQTWLRVAAP